MTTEFQFRETPISLHPSNPAAEPAMGKTQIPLEEISHPSLPHPHPSPPSPLTPPSSSPTPSLGMDGPGKVRSRPSSGRRGSTGSKTSVGGKISSAGATRAGSGTKGTTKTSRDKDAPTSRPTQAGGVRKSRRSAATGAPPAKTSSSSSSSSNATTSRSRTSVPVKGRGTATTREKPGPTIQKPHHPVSGPGSSRPEKHTMTARGPQLHTSSSENLTGKPPRGKRAPPTTASKHPPQGGTQSQLKPTRHTPNGPEAASPKGVREKKAFSPSSQRKYRKEVLETTDDETDIEERDQLFEPEMGSTVSVIVPHLKTEFVSFDDQDEASLAGSNGSSLEETGFPALTIGNSRDSKLFFTLALRVQKWKMLGRYLGVNDANLFEIESKYHFISERCLKMLIQWAETGGTYCQLEAGLRNIMREDLIDDLRCFVPPEPADLEEVGEGHWKSSGLNINRGKINFSELQQKVAAFANQDNHHSVRIEFTHAKLDKPLEFSLPLSCHCDLTILEELCLAAHTHTVTEVSLDVKLV